MRTISFSTPSKHHINYSEWATLYSLFLSTMEWRWMLSSTFQNCKGGKAKQSGGLYSISYSLIQNQLSAVGDIDETATNWLGGWSWRYSSRLGKEGFRMLPWLLLVPLLLAPLLMVQPPERRHQRAWPRRWLRCWQLWWAGKCCCWPTVSTWNLWSRQVQKAVVWSTALCCH